MLTFCFEERAPVAHVMGKNATKLAQIFASLIQGRDHKGKWTSLYLLPDLCPLHFSCCYVKSQTSVRSPLLTQLQQSVRVLEARIRQFERVNCIGIKNLIYILVFVLF